MIVHWRLPLGGLVAVAAWGAAVVLGAPAPLRALIGWDVGSLVYIVLIAHLFVTEGEGAVGVEPLRPLTTIYLPRGARVTMSARTPVAMLHLGMPDLSGLEARRGAVTAAAAE